MLDVTYFAALPFGRNEEGELCAGEAAECRSFAAAIACARSMAAAGAGAVAFSRTGYPDQGEWADAVVIGRVGETPKDLEIASGSCPYLGSVAISGMDGGCLHISY